MLTYHGRAVVFLAFALASCSLARGTIGPGRDAATDAAPLTDAGTDAGVPDDADRDSGPDAGSDGGTDVGPPDAGPTHLDLFAGGTFVRASEASYRTTAATDGTSAFLAWAPPNTRRVEDRGDGMGPMLLLEGQRTNLVRASRDITDAAAWQFAGLATITADGGPGPDGTMAADRVVATGGGFSNGTSLIAMLGTPHVISAFGRASSGTTEWRTDYANAMAWSGSVDTTWARRDAQQLSNGANWYAVNGFGTPYDMLVDLFQAETGTFPTSPIRTSSTSATRAADQLVYAVGEYPAELLSRGFTLTYAPDCSSTELVASNEDHVLLSTDGSNFFALSVSAGAVHPLLFTHGAAQIGGATEITFARYQALTFLVEPMAGRVTVTGATLGNGVVIGAATDIMGTSLTIGSGPHPSFGRFGRYISVP